MADLKQFISKNKPVTIYTEALVEFYNYKNCKQIYKMYEMIEFKKMRTSIAKNPRNFSVYQIIKVFLILNSAHVVFKDQNKVIFYVNNYID